MMKYVVKLMIFVLFISFTACEGMNDIIDEYLDRGELNYIGTPDSARCDGGFYRVNLTWMVGNDVRVEACKIEWNMGMDSIICPIDRNNLINGYASMTFPVKEEGQHVFNLYQMGEKGETSIPFEVIGKAYGEQYISGLIPRYVKWSKVIENWMIIDWGNVNDSERVVLHYTTSNGTQKSVTVLTEDTRTVLSDFKSGEDIVYETIYLPEQNAIDEISKKSIIKYSDMIAPYPFGEPFNGPHFISKTTPLVLSAADFDKGGEGFGYHDTTPTNEAGGDYRSGESVGITPDNIVAYNADGEWLNYTVEVKESALYRVVVNLATNGSAKFDFEVDGEKQTEIITAPNKSSWGDYFEFDDNIILHLTKGKHTIKYYMHAGSMNFKSFTFTYEAPWSSWNPLN